MSIYNCISRNSDYCTVSTKLSQHLPVLTDNSFFFKSCLSSPLGAAEGYIHFLLGRKEVMAFLVSELSSKEVCNYSKKKKKKKIPRSLPQFYWEACNLCSFFHEKRRWTVSSKCSLLRRNDKSGRYNRPAGKLRDQEL